MIRFAENLNKMIAAGLGGAMEAPRTEVAVGHRIRYPELSGTVASFETNIVAPIQSLRVDMQPIQAGRGDPSPDNIRPISGRDSVTVERTGGNLFDLNPDKVVRINGDNNFTLDYSTPDRVIAHVSRAASNYTIWEAFEVTNQFVGQTITFSRQTDKDARIVATATAVDSWTSAAPSELTPGSAETASYTIKATDVGRKIGIRFLYGSATGVFFMAYPMLNLGSTATAYEPYDGASVTVQFGQTVYGGTAEIISGQGQSDYALVTYTGAASEAWSAYQTFPHHFQINVSPGNAKNTDREINAISNAYPAQAGMANNNIGVPYGVFSADGNRIRIKDVDCSTVEEFKAKLQSIPGGLQVCYRLAEPQTLTLDPATLSTGKGDNNVWSDAGNISLEYPYYEETEGY